MKLTLFFSPTACSRVPLVALEEIGAPFDIHLVKFAKGENRSPEFLALNPAGKVPVLVADGKAISQNSAIQIFLARTFPKVGLLPFTGDLVNDAQIMGKLIWFSADLHPIVNRIRIPVMTCDAAPARVKEQAIESMRKQLDPMEATLRQQPWVLGDQWSILDAYLQWVWFRITGAGFDETDYPALVDHHKRIGERPSMQRALAYEDKAFAELEKHGASFSFSKDSLTADRPGK